MRDSVSPRLNWGVGMAYVSAAHAKIGEQIQIEIRRLTSAWLA